MPKSMTNLAAEIIDGVFERAAVRTGRTPEQLRAMAVEVFASMLHHSMETPGQVVLTASCIIDGRLDLEVGLPPRQAARGVATPSAPTDNPRLTTAEPKVLP